MGRSKEKTCVVLHLYLIPLQHAHSMRGMIGVMRSPNGVGHINDQYLLEFSVVLLFIWTTCKDALNPMQHKARYFGAPYHLCGFAPCN